MASWILQPLLLLLMVLTAPSTTAGKKTFHPCNVFNSDLECGESFFSFECDSDGCPPDSTCDPVRRTCNCSAGFFSWGKSCVAQRYSTTDCPTTHCGWYVPAHCVGSTQCQCSKDTHGVVQDSACVSVVMTRAFCKLKSACGLNGECGADSRYPDEKVCYCKPGFAFDTFRTEWPQFECIPMEALPKSDHYNCSRVGEECPGGRCLSSKGTTSTPGTAHIRCYCTRGKKGGACVIPVPATSKAAALALALASAQRHAPSPAPFHAHSSHTHGSSHHEKHHHYHHQ